MSSKFNNLTPIIQKNINTMVRANQSVHDVPPMVAYKWDFHSVRRPLHNPVSYYGVKGVGGTNIPAV